MNVRSASFRDLGRIEQLHREAVAREDDGSQGAGFSTADSPVPQTALVRLWYGVSKAVSNLVPLSSDSGTSLLVAEDGERDIAGFVQAQGVPGQPKAWHVTNLCVAPTARGHFAGAPLLLNLVNQGVEHSVTRFMARVPVGHPLLSVFIEQGFTQYATEQILYRDDSAAAPRIAETSTPLRPVRREDVGAIHLLYLRTTPSHVANVEGPNRAAWQSLFHNGCMARIGRDDWRHVVLERPGVVAWAGVRHASQIRPALLALMCDGQDAELREEVVDAALAAVPPGPLSCVLRHYDSELIRTLQGRGFEIYGTQLLLVRDLAIKVRLQAAVREKKRPALVPAGVAHSATLAPFSLTPHRPPAIHITRSTTSSRT